MAEQQLDSQCQKQNESNTLNITLYESISANNLIKNFPIDSDIEWSRGRRCWKAYMLCHEPSLLQFSSALSFSFNFYTIQL